LEEVIKDIKKGRMVIIVDDDLAESGGVFFTASELTTKENINFMMKHGTGFAYIALPEEKTDQITFPQMNRFDKHSGPNSYDLSVDYINAGSGITAEDRTLTIKKLLKEPIDHSNFKTPGHVFILKAIYGGVLKKAANAEAASDLAGLSGGYPSGVISEILNDAGEVLRSEELLRGRTRHNFTCNISPKPCGAPKLCT
jgi:3,4-dihydroxy 2-butanone 4-phosphate synthase/GTP cyclohydrolase II